MTGTAVLWPGRGMYRVVEVIDGPRYVLDGLEGQERTITEGWRCHPIARPLAAYPPIPKEPT